VIKSLETYKQVFGLSKVTFYPLDYYVMNITSQNINANSKKMVSTIDFIDETSGTVMPIAAISLDKKQLIEQIMFKHFDIANSNERI